MRPACFVVGAKHNFLHACFGLHQVKLNRMSTSLRNARNQISSLQGRLERLSLLNMDNVQAIVDKRVENITGVVNKLSSTCTTECPAVASPQGELAFIKIINKNICYIVTF